MRFWETAWFTKLDQPATRVGGAITAIVAVALGAVAFAQNPSPSHACSTNPLRGVYNPHRLQVVQTCATIDVTVHHSSKERDGDLHIQGAADPKWLRPRNYTNQSGYLVVEYMPGDPWPRPKVGDRLRLTCTFVLDKQHGGWSECHPVWAVQPLGVAAVEVEP